MAQPTTVTTEYFPHQSRAQGQLASLSAVWSPAWNYRGIPVSSRRGFYRYMTNRLTANKLTLNRKKSNFVIFRPYQKRLNYLPQVNIFNDEENKNVTLEHKNCIKCLGLLIDENLGWKNHIYTPTTKINKTVGLIAKLRHIVPNRTLLDDINTSSAPINISNLFSKITSVHSYGTHSSTSEHFNTKKSSLNVQSKAFFTCWR